MWSRFYEKCRTNLWLVPGLMGLFGLIFATALLYIELNFQPLLRIKWFNELEAKTLTVTVSTLLGAIVTVFGILLPVTFSILLRAANQFTPIILRIYRADLTHKLFLGLIFATALYLMTMLIGLNYLFFPIIPNLSILFAFAFVLLTICSIPWFFDKFATSLEPTYVVASIATDVKKMIEKLQETNHIKDAQLPIRQPRHFLEQQLYHYAIFAPKTGYTQVIDHTKILKICTQKHLIAATPICTGDFVLEGNPILYYKNAQPLDEQSIQILSNCFVFGEERTCIDNLSLQLEELLSIVLKALSPGVADTATALECINYVGSTCNLILNRNFPSGIHRDEHDIERYYSKEFDFYEFAHIAFDSIRKNATFHFVIIFHVLDLLHDLIINCRNRARAEVLKEIAQQLIEEIQEHYHAYDKKVIQQQFRKIDQLAIFQI